MPGFDYVISKQNVKLDLGSGTEFVPHGVRLHGDLVESWGGSVADRLVEHSLLARVPHDPDAKHYVAQSAAVPEAEPEDEAGAAPEDAEVDEAELDGSMSYPRHTGFGNYELSDGSTVKGKDAAAKAQAALEIDAEADAADADEADAPEGAE